MAVASAGLMVPTSSSRTSLLQAFRRGPGTYIVFAGPRYGQYQPCREGHYCTQILFQQ